MHGDRPLVMHMDCAASGLPTRPGACFVAAALGRHRSATNGAVLRFRDPVYRSLRELAMSYFHEYTATGAAARRCAAIPSPSTCGGSIRSYG